MGVSVMKACLRSLVVVFLAVIPTALFTACNECSNASKADALMAELQRTADANDTAAYCDWQRTHAGDLAGLYKMSANLYQDVFGETYRPCRKVCGPGWIITGCSTVCDGTPYTTAKKGLETQDGLAGKMMTDAQQLTDSVDYVCAGSDHEHEFNQPRGWLYWIREMRESGTELVRLSCGSR